MKKTLPYCCKKHGLSKAETDIVVGYAKEYRDEGYEPHVANVSAVERMLDELKEERKTIVSKAGLTKLEKSDIQEQRVDAFQSLSDISEEYAAAVKQLKNYYAEDVIAKAANRGETLSKERADNYVNRKYGNEEIDKTYAGYLKGEVTNLPNDVKKMFDDLNKKGGRLGILKKDQSYEVAGTKAVEQPKVVAKDRKESVEARRQKIVDLLVDRGTLVRGTDGKVPMGAFNIVVPTTPVEMGVVEVGELLGLDVLYYTSSSLKPNLINGMFHPAMPRTVFIRKNSTNPLLQVVGHEFVHTLEKNHPTQFENLITILLESGHFSGKKWDAWKKHLDRITNKEYSNMTDAAKSEYLADLIGDLLLKPKFATSLRNAAEAAPVVDNLKGAFDKRVNSILRTLDSILKKIGNFITGRKNLSDALGVNELSRISKEIAAVLEQVTAKESDIKRDAIVDGAAESKDLKMQASDSPDSRYLALARDPEKNRAELQAMVDEAAKAAGFTVEAYHGTTKKFTSFSEKKIGKADRSVTANFGFFFSPNEKEATRYAKWNNANGRVLSVALSIKNPYKMPYTEFDELAMYEYNQMKNSGYRFSESDARKWSRQAKKAVLDKKAELISRGYDGVLVEKLDEHIAFYPGQIKSADPVTYYKADDPEVISGEKKAGDIIPLSERFKDTSDDIRFQDATAPAGEPINIDNVRRAFRGREVGESNDGGYWVKIRDGVFLTVRPVKDINQHVIEMEYGVSPTITKAKAGSYGQGKILLSTQYADRITLYHETFHALEDMRLVTLADQQVLNTAIRKAGIYVNWADPMAAAEARAEFVGRGLQSREDYAKTPVGRVLQKIADFIDAMINAFHPTARGVMRDIESGQVFEREGIAPTGVVYFQDADVERFGVEQTRQRLAKWANWQWKALAAGANRSPSAPRSTIAPADMKRGVLGFLNSLLPFYAHTKKFTKNKEAHDIALEGQANQHRMNYDDGRKTRSFYKDLKTKADKQVVMDLLDEEDVNGMFLTEAEVRERLQGNPNRELIIAAWKGMRGAINDRLKEMIRTTLPRTLVDLGDSNKEAAEIIFSARDRDELKTRMQAFLDNRGLKLSSGELDHVSFLYDYMQAHKGYVPHKWQHPWRVRFSTKDGVVIRDFPLGVSAAWPREEQRTAAAVKHAEMLVAEEMGWTEAEIKQAQANSDMIEDMITRKRELVAAKKESKDKDEIKALNKEMAELQKEIDKILENEPTFKVIHSREMPTDYFEGARPEQMMAIISKSLDATMEKLGAKNPDVEALFDSIEGQVQAEMELMYLKKGSLKSLIKRKNIKGYRKDFDNVVAEYLTETASAMSKMDMARKFSKTLASIDPTRQPALWQEIKDYIKDILAPTPEATLFKKVAGIMYLGADLSAVILNTTQNFTHGTGVLSTIPQKGGGNAVTQLVWAEKDIANAWIQSKKSGEDFLHAPTGRITAQELEILNKLKNSGKLDPQLLGEQTGFKVNQIAEDQRVMTYMFKLFGAAEGMNRLSLALAVSRRALSAGKSVEEATQIAADAVHKAHFPYGRSNRPKLVRALDRATGKLAAGSVAWTFMTYPMMNIVYIRDNVWDAMEGVYKGDKVQARNAMKMIGSQLAFTMLFGGMTALPFYGLAQFVASIFGDDGDDDWETMIRRQVDGILGEDVSRGVTRGAPAMFKLFDMSQSVEGTDVFQTPIGLQVLGNMKKRLGESWDMAAHEEYLPAVFHLTPDFSRNIYRAFMGMEKGGEHRFAPPIKYTPGEAMTRAVGLTPVRESEAYKKASSALAVQASRTDMINDMARRVSNDRGNIREVRKEMNQYNRKGLPRIVWNDILKAMKRQKEARQKNMTDRPAKYMERYEKELDKVYGG